MKHLEEVFLQQRELLVEVVCDMSQLVSELLPLLVPLQLEVLRHLGVPRHPLVDLPLKLTNHSLVLLPDRFDFISLFLLASAHQSLQSLGLFLGAVHFLGQLLVLSLSGSKLCTAINKLSLCQL